ncbi:hypothetical protein B0T25DRAFT_602517 [Lasiosphaeria hispida]|uniref:Cdc24/Scd1 N-terminal domain-containing protein n=1 Tax=Lasiosphaeria hispida TaxID=260671 RepID=A0AAJ0HT08_9PEZI|nr:hypothetical protein B0T25DRAFT_602517 [Lasiosphaeria hispida]
MESLSDDVVETTLEAAVDLEAREAAVFGIQPEALLSQLTQCSLNQIIARERSVRPDSDDHYRERWREFLSHERPTPSTKLALLEFIQACSTRQGIPIEYCFTVTDLLYDDTTGHVKVKSHPRPQIIVNQILSKLVNAEVIEAVDVGSSPGLHDFKNPLSPQTLAVEELVRQDRAYVARLEYLAGSRGEIVRSHGIVLVGDMEAADDFLQQSRQLIDKSAVNLAL